LQNNRHAAQDGLRGFCRDLDDSLMTGQGRFSEFTAVMTLSLFSVYAWLNTSRVLEVSAAIRGSFFLPAIQAKQTTDRSHALRGNASRDAPRPVTRSVTGCIPTRERGNDQG
jgi:hypothetical protein